jgi:ATP-dependent RNA helicase DDX10/DBP4
MADGESGAVLGGSSDEYDEEMEEAQSEEETGHKRESKWFESDSDDEEESRKRAKLIEVEQPETIADQEALALKLLGAA